MLNIKEVEDAKTLMSVAVNWSVVRWLAEKKKVRKAADLANGTLDTLDQEVKKSWSDELKAAYDELPSTVLSPERVRIQPKGNGPKVDIDPEIKLLAKSLKKADEEAWAAHLLAEDTFDRAEKILSTSMARQGTREAITSWELREKAIIKSKEAVGVGKAAK